MRSDENSIQKASLGTEYRILGGLFSRDNGFRGHCFDDGDADFVNILLSMKNRSEERGVYTWTWRPSTRAVFETAL